MNMRFNKAWGHELPNYVDLMAGRRKRLLYRSKAAIKDSDVDDLAFALGDTRIPYHEIESHSRPPYA